MKAQTALNPQLARVSIFLNAGIPLVDLACFLRQCGLRLRWNVQHRALETAPV